MCWCPWSTCFRTNRSAVPMAPPPKPGRKYPVTDSHQTTAPPPPNVLDSIAPAQSNPDFPVALGAAPVRLLGWLDCAIGVLLLSYGAIVTCRASPATVSLQFCSKRSSVRTALLPSACVLAPWRASSCRTAPESRRRPIAHPAQRQPDLGRGAGAVGADVGVPDMLAAGACGPGLPQSTP